MISPTQQEALDLLADVCDLSLDVRLGQLLAHLGFLGEDQTGRSLWDIDDEQLLAVLYHHRAELTSRQSSSANQKTQTTGIAVPLSQNPQELGSSPVVDK